ncbi:glycerol-3-phosphate O-acyltransferase domain protein [Leptospira interrogans serovar Bataviae str. HAI135]|nr:glycerol-3-phosphate O-acyltransferase domain protein [Leptospira interrogans serovar Bataviae str. HAI135]
MDIRKLGSKNIGATNVGRLIGWKFGFIVLALDITKGMLPVYLSGVYVSEGGIPFQLLCGVFAVLGHMFSPFWDLEEAKVLRLRSEFFSTNPDCLFRSGFSFLGNI